MVAYMTGHHLHRERAGTHTKKPASAGKGKKSELGVVRYTKACHVSYWGESGHANILALEHYSMIQTCSILTINLA